jgi:predicted RNase H-like HicB family nuclease
MKYAVVFEPTSTGYSAYVPDLDGCVASGATLDEAHVLMSEALALHIAGMVEDGDLIPDPSHVEFVSVAAAV